MQVARREAFFSRLSWLDSARAADVELNHSDITNRKPGVEYLGPSERLLETILGHLHDANFVWFPDNLTAYRHFANMWDIGRASRTFELNLMQEIARKLEREKTRPDIVTAEQKLYPFSGIVNFPHNIESHIDTFPGTSKLTFFGYSPGYGMEENGVLNWWNLNDYQGEEFFEGNNSLLDEYVAEAQSYTPERQNPILLPFGIGVDGKVGHSASGKISTVEDPRRWIRKIVLLAHPSYLGRHKYNLIPDQFILSNGEVDESKIEQLNTHFVSAEGHKLIDVDFRRAMSKLKSKA